MLHAQVPVQVRQKLKQARELQRRQLPMGAAPIHQAPRAVCTQFLHAITQAEYSKQPISRLRCKIDLPCKGLPPLCEWCQSI